MDKIPFTSPEEPIHKAWVSYLKQQNRDWFNEYALVQAILKLKQGFGRLIRTKTDRGLVAILDPRLRTKAYGKRILRSLPPVHILHDREALSQYAEGTLGIKSSADMSSLC